MAILFFVSLLWAFFLGSIPTGYLTARLKHIDLTSIGSGNVGATNAFRALGSIPGIIVLIVDILKGFAATYFLTIFFLRHMPGAENQPFDPNDKMFFGMMFGLAAIAGHVWNPFLHFKGGKGVATAFGVLLALDPMLGLFTLLVFLGVFLVSGYVSLGSLIAIVAAMALSIIIDRGIILDIFLILALIVIFITHIPNIHRLAKGVELKLKNPHK